MKHSRRSTARSAPVSLSIVVSEPSWRGEKNLLPAIRRAARIAAAAPRANGEATVEPMLITILLTGDSELRDLNARFRNKHTPTNVLSFPAAPGFEPHLGDIAIGFGVVAREAREARKSLEAHAAHLTVHGVLHLLGYDHNQTDEATIMEALEISILARMGIPNPYGRAPARRRSKASGVPA